MSYALLLYIWELYRVLLFHRPSSSLFAPHFIVGLQRHLVKTEVVLF